MKYWLIVTNPNNYGILRDNLEFRLIGFSNRYRKKAGEIKTGDQIVYYITNIHKFGAIVTVDRRLLDFEKNKIWISQFNHYPLCFQTKPTLVLNGDELKKVILPVEQLDFIKNKKAWGVYFRLSLREISEHDFKIIKKLLLSTK
jgi:predicted RNA-binding protein